MILIVAVGQKQPSWVNEAFEDYAKRLPADWRIELREVKAEPRTTGKTVAAMMAAEAERMNTTLQKEKYGGDLVTIALDEQGKDFTTQQFAEFINKFRSRGARMAFLIGGPDGLDESLKTECSLKLRLSSMTIPHGMARIVLLEQIYRAWSIQEQHPYHRS